MDPEAFEHHVTSPQGAGHRPVADHVTITADGGACGDAVTFSLATDGVRVTDAGFTADGCAATSAAASAAVSLVVGTSLLDAARIGTREIAAELGGLSAGKLHAADVAADATARALGAAAYERGCLSPPGGGEARTLVAMSSGVDSTVAALLVAEHGPAVTVTLELWADRESDAERSCCSSSAVAQARSLAHRMGLPHFTLDLRDAFRTGVVEPFLDAHRVGETPNPCVRCNGHVRLDAMLELATRLGCATLATGHYARTQDGLLRAAADSGKDQTYMLSALAPESLARMRFPLGELHKPRVREIAAKAGLPVAAKPDSQDLCFLAGTSSERFLARHGGIVPRRGEIVDAGGMVVGIHSGHERLTVGQRHGIGTLTAPSAEPRYVVAKDAARNRVLIGPRSALQASTVRVRDVRLHREAARVDRVKLRYRTDPFPARLTDQDVPAGFYPAATLELARPVAGAAPGQLACLMDGDLVVGWGTICR